MQRNQYQQLIESLGNKTTLVAVSKMQSVEAIRQLYVLGHRDFGENYVQELIEKQLLLPEDIRWHFIGHLQSNKVRYIAPFIHLVQSIDSVKLLTEIDREAKKVNRVIDCLLQVHIASEDTKFGLQEAELDELVHGILKANEVNELINIRVCGLMGMSSLTDDPEKIHAEHKYLSTLYDKYAATHTAHFHFRYLSMGMSADFRIALEEGSNMVRLGSSVFGARK